MDHFYVGGQDIGDVSKDTPVCPHRLSIMRAVEVLLFVQIKQLLTLSLFICKGLAPHPVYFSVSSEQEHKR